MLLKSSPSLPLRGLGCGRQRTDGLREMTLLEAEMRIPPEKPSPSRRYSLIHPALSQALEQSVGCRLAFSKWRGIVTGAMLVVSSHLDLTTQEKEENGTQPTTPAPFSNMEVTKSIIKQNKTDHRHLCP